MSHGLWAVKSCWAGPKVLKSKEIFTCGQQQRVSCIDLVILLTMTFLKHITFGPKETDYSETIWGDTGAELTGVNFRDLKMFPS